MTYRFGQGLDQNTINLRSGHVHRVEMVEQLVVIDPVCAGWLWIWTNHQQMKQQCWHSLTWKLI